MILNLLYFCSWQIFQLPKYRSKKCVTVT